MARTLLCGVAALALGAVAEPLQFGDGPLGLTFAPEADGYGIRRIENRLGAGVSFVDPDGKGADFWELEFHSRRADGTVETAKLDNRSPAAKRRMASKGDRVGFRWEGLSLPGETDVVDVTAAVVLSGDGASADWSISVKNRSRRWALFETRYPCLQRVVPNGAADVLFPSKQLGMRLLKGFCTTNLPRTVVFSPWWRPSLTAFMQQGLGLEVWAKDGEMRLKNLVFMPGASMRYETLVENAGVVGKAAEGPRFPVRTTVFAGDWWNVARRYREWARRQKWAEKGPMAKRRDFPASLRDNAAWMVVNGGGGVSNLALRLRKEWPKAAIGLDWAKWQYVPFDSTYPEMLPALPGVREAMDVGRGAGVLMKPYTNGRLWNKSLASYAYAEKDATKEESGQVFDEEYGKWHFAVMCPGSKAWRDIFVANTSNIVDTISATAVYVDQVACSRAIPCFDSSHGHPLGGGSYWADGCREMLTRLHGILSAKGVSISSEGAGEAYMGVVDGFDLASESHPDDLPFYTAVYGGYGVYNGSSIADTKDFPAFFASQARAAIWGCSLETGWYCNWPLCEKDARFSAAYAALAETRNASREFLVEGYLDGDVRLNEAQETLSFEWGTRYGPKDRRYTAKFPAVFGTVFRSHDGSRCAVALANVSGEERCVSFSAPFSGGATLPPYSVRVVSAP